MCIIRGMKPSDTSQEAQQVLNELLQKMPIERKIRQVFSAYATGRELAIAGIRQRHPQASDSKIWHLWAQQHLGPSLFRKVYGKIPRE